MSSLIIKTNAEYKDWLKNIKQSFLQTLQENLKSSLPSIEEIEAELARDFGDE